MGYSGAKRGEVTAKNKTAERLDAYEARYRQLALQLADIGYIASGSIGRRLGRCGKPNCACHADPPRLHGPYWHWTATVHGKTVNRRFTQRQAELYSQWIANDRQARALLDRMRKVAAKATELLLEEAAREQDQTTAEPVTRARRHPARRTRAQ